MPDVTLPTDPRPRGALSLPSFVAGGALAAVIAYFADPDRGRSRRAQARDRLRGQLRRVSRHGGRTTRHLTHTASGKVRMVTHRRHGRHEAPNDALLAAKVKTELFRDPTIPKGHLNLNAENGVVVLRGIVPTIHDHERIVARIRRVDDVVDVHSLLHVRDESDFGDPASDPREWLNLRDATFPY